MIHLGFCRMLTVEICPKLRFRGLQRTCLPVFEPSFSTKTSRRVCWWLLNRNFWKVSTVKILHHQEWIIDIFYAIFEPLLKVPFLLDNQNFGFKTVFIMDYEIYVFRAVGLASTGIFILKTFVCQILPFLKLLDTLYGKFLMLNFSSKAFLSASF